MKSTIIHLCLIAILFKNATAARSGHRKGRSSGRHKIEQDLQRLVAIEHKIAEQRANSVLRGDTYSTAQLEAYGIESRRMLTAFHSTTPHAHAHKRNKREVREHADATKTWRTMCSMEHLQIEGHGPQFFDFYDRNVTKVQVEASNTFNIVMCNPESENQVCSNVDKERYSSACETAWRWQYATVRRRADSEPKITEVLTPWTCSCALQSRSSSTLHHYLASSDDGNIIV